MIAEKRIQKEHIYLMRLPEYALYSGVMMLGSVTVVDDDSVTARTDGRNVQYGRKFVEGLTDKQLRFLILHENMHKALRHVSVWRGLFEKNAAIAMVACDAVINNILQDGNDGGHIEFISGGVNMPEMRGLSVKQIFNKIRSICKQVSLDFIDSKSAGSMTEKEVKELQRSIEQALRQGRILASKLSGSVPKEIDEVLEPVIDWRKELAEFLQEQVLSGRDISTWRKINRRWLPQDLYLPGLSGEGVNKICVAIDASGSISGKEMSEFLAEIKAIVGLASEKMDLVFWDTSITSHQKLDSFDASKIKPAGGGGTSPRCVAEWLSGNKMDCCVVFTDGYVDEWSSMPCPSIWCVSGGGSTDRHPSDKTIRIEK